MSLPFYTDLLRQEITTQDQPGEHGKEELQGVCRQRGKSYLRAVSALAGLHLQILADVSA